MKVDYIIAGAQKCGTTALHTFLSKHPSIIGSNPKEIDFFNYEERFKNGLKYYHSNFRKPTYLEKLFKKKRFLEASVTYLSDCDILQTAQRIKSYNNNIKIIGLVRDPKERAFSAWNMYKNRFYIRDKDWWLHWKKIRSGTYPDVVRRNPEEYEDFEIFVSNEIKSLEEKRDIECGVLEIGNYYKGIEIFQNIFKSNFLIVKNESLLSETISTLEKVCVFLEVKEHNWSKFQNVKIFKGEYDTEMNQKSRNLLNSYYRDANERLRVLTGINYN